MKNLHTFESFCKSDETINEAFKLGAEGEKLLSKMSVNGDRGKWDLHLVDLDDSGDEYIIITGEYSRSVSSDDTVWIPKAQWDEFKKLINSI